MERAVSDETSSWRDKREAWQDLARIAEMEADLQAYRCSFLH